MFAYCGNNPVDRVDASGQLWGAVLAGYLVVYTVTAVVDVFQLFADGENAMNPTYTSEKESVRIHNSYKINTGLVQYGYCFYLNHFSEYKNYFKGTTAGMTFEWFIHNVGYKWFSMLEFFENNPDGEVSDNTISKGRCSEVDLGPTIFHDSKGKESSLSTGMKALYVISTPLGALFDYIMYTLN